VRITLTIFIILFLLGCGSSVDNTSANSTISLQLRTYYYSLTTETYDNEEDSHYVYETREYDTQEVALLLIDLWEYCQNDGWIDRATMNMQTHILPLIQWARQKGIFIIYSPHHHEMSSLITVQNGEMVVEEEWELADMLHDMGITTILYAGYATNMCVLFRPDGMVRMDWNGFTVHLIRDCSIAVETRETLATEGAYHAALNIIDTRYGSTLLEELN